MYKVCLSSKIFFSFFLKMYSFYVYK
jgi:hypothetical protein